MTHDQAKRAELAVRVLIHGILDTIKECGAEGAPSGVIYAALVGTLSLDQYTLIIEGFKKHGLVRESGHVLYYVEPSSN